MAAGAAELDGATRRPRRVASGLGRRRTGPAAGPDDRLAHLAYRLSPHAGGTPRWSATIDHLSGRTPRNRSDVAWAGSGSTAVSRLRDLAAQWRELLTGLAVDELEQSSSFPWGPNTGHTVAHTALWVNIELTKNIAEIGQLRLIRAARG